MKNISQKLSSALLALILGLSPLTGFAQSKSEAPSGQRAAGEIKGFDKSVFDYHFSRADRELDPGRWISEARRGMGLALKAWEFFAPDLYDNPLLLEGAKKQIEEWSAAELEERFTQWLMGRFFGGAAKEIAETLSSEISETQIQYTYHLDSKGKVIYDDKTGDPSVIRPGEEGREFSADLDSWRGAVKKNIANSAASFEAAIARIYPELLTYIPPEMRESMGAKIAAAGAAFSETMRREFERLAAREERIFTSRRTGDLWSLRKKSDDEAAWAITARLIGETEDACARDIAGLASRIEEASAGSGDLVIMGEEWLEMYREQFERGLKAWEQAEERFFIRRIEWEQEAGRLFAEGEETWAAAFKQFDEQRKKWELQTKELYESGEALFKNASANLEKAIAEAKIEFALNFQMRTEAGSSRARALIDMYLTCGAGLAAARENILFWLKQYSPENKIDPAGDSFKSWLEGELKKQGFLNKTSANLLAEIKKSYDLYVSYFVKANDAREKIIADYNDLIGGGTLKDILSDNLSSEDFALDEYQAALIKAKAVVQYWERQTAIAGAVSAYAEDLTAGRMTEAEGLRAWEAAKAAYNESLARYEKELQNLNAIGADLREKQAALDILALEMKEKEELLNGLNLEYSALIAANAVNRDDYMLVEFNVKYAGLLTEYRLLTQSGDGALYKNSLEYALELGIAEQTETAQGLRDMLINGDGENLKSLAELREEAALNPEAEMDLKIRLSAIDLLEAQSSADWYCKAWGFSLSEGEKAALSGRKLAERLVSDVADSFYVLLEKRIALEKEALECFLNGSAETESDGAFLSRFCLADRDEAAKGFAVLQILEERLQAGEDYFNGSYEDDETGEIIAWFIEGGSFFSGSGAFLAGYLDSYRLSGELLNLYENFGGASSFVLKESWQDSLHEMGLLFAAYGLGGSGSLLPDMQSLCAALLKMPGDFVSNTANFLREFDACFPLIPEWLDSEINNWENAFAEYAALAALYRGKIPEKNTASLALEQEEIENRYAILSEYYNSLEYTGGETVRNIQLAYTAINEDEILLSYKSLITGIWEQSSLEAADAEKEKTKHWRQYLAGEYLTEPDGLITGAASWKEGMMLDALNNAALNTRLINDAFILYSSNDRERQAGETDFLLENYEDETLKIQRHLNNAAVLQEELARLGWAYEYTKMAPDVFKKELETLYTALKAQESAFNAIRDRYLLDAERFAVIGTQYDGQCAQVKKKYESMEEKRFEYETQDAIRRWASTAYLELENDDLNNCKERLLKAQTVLAVLSDLYNSEERRPYDNPAYQEIYSKYEQSFNKALVSVRALNTLNAAIAQESINNDNMFKAYESWLNTLGNVPRYEADYIPPSDRGGWDIKDIITVQNGRLAFSKNGSMRLDAAGANEVKALQDYFDGNQTAEGKRHEISNFEIALEALSQRMESYFKLSGKIYLWGLARDYLIRALIESNGDIGFLQNKYVQAEALMKGGSLARAPYKTNWNSGIEYVGNYISGKKNALYKSQQQAWDSLSAEEKADLEFYVIITLSGNVNNYIYGFSQYTALKQYQTAHDMVKKHYKKAEDKVSRWWEFGFVYTEMRDINKSTYNRLKKSLKQTELYAASWLQGLSANISRIKDYSSAYAASCARLDELEGTAVSGQSIGWNEISRVMTLVGSLNAEDTETLRVSWEAMIRDTGGFYADVSEGLTQLTLWTGIEREKNKQALDNQWRLDDQNRQEKEKGFYKTVESFIAGNTDIKSLSAAAKAAYGNDTAAWKNHLENIGKILISDIGGFLDYGADYFADFSALGDEYVSLFDRAFTSRYNAELAVREAEWEEQRRDLAEKYRTWQEKAALISGRGREDWKTGEHKMEEAYKQWYRNFLEEQKRVSASWAEAYLAGLEDKEQWLEQAAAAADQAASGAFLSLIGADAERMARVMDTRIPVGIPGAVPEAEKLLAELFNAPGLGNAGSIFGTLNGIADLSAAAVRRGMGGLSTWDAGIVRAAAADLARETNAELADRDARRLAFNARSAGMEALKGLAANVDAANNSFRESMDRIYIVQGQWKKSGRKYIKDIIVGSTVFQPVITEEKKVEGYVDYRMDPLTLKTNLDENYLAGLNSFAVMGLIENVYREIEAAGMEIFGNGESREIRSGEGKDMRLRYLGSGKFGGYIGYEPALRPSGGSGKSRDSFFYDQGSGELGRLMSDFYYWAIIDGRGSAKISIATWDKPLWDDRGSVFSAPTIRSAADTAGKIAATVVGAVAAPATGGASMLGMMALMAGMDTTDDLLFNAMDTAYNYKTIDEAGFAFGKAVAVSSISNLGSAAFNSLSSAATQAASGAAGKALASSAMVGAQAVTTGLAVSSVEGISYSRENGWGYSTGILTQGINGTMIGALSSMTSVFTSAMLKNINSGINMEKLTGFSMLNMENVDTLNEMLGAVAGQGVQYAAGGDFTLNLLNASLLTGGKINSGMLELRLGHDGSFKMNPGSGGVNISPNSVLGAVQGALVWNLNNRIDKYTRNNEFREKATLRAQYGFGDREQKKQLENILAGTDEIRINTGESYEAKTEIIKDRRIIMLGAYEAGMSAEEQMRLAVIFGHEAYRDGDEAGDTLEELRGASIARVLMGDRINQDYQWFYDINVDFAFESFLFEAAKQTGNADLFNDYLQFAYENGEDYFWQWTSTGNEYQNMDAYRSIPLFNAKSEERVKEINGEKFEAAFAAYKADLAQKEGYTGAIEDFVSKDGKTDSDLRRELQDNKDIWKKFGYEPLKFESIYLAGCMFMSTKYGAEAITGKKFDTLWLNEYIKENGLIHKGTESDLSNELMARIMNLLGEGAYTVSLEQTGLPDAKQLWDLGRSNIKYLAHVRIKKEGTGSAYHSAMVSGIDYTYDGEGNVTGIGAIHTANPWNGNSFSGKTTYTPDQIARWDIFKVASKPKVFTGPYNGNSSDWKSMAAKFLKISK
ncbi:MAG: hypothetical protein LBG57_12835 [Treponema sp.]|nr:hypothetical protein [Treponema sp.]